MILGDRNSAIEAAKNLQGDTLIFSDGLGYEGGIGAAAELYQGEELLITAKDHLGSKEVHTVFESELMGTRHSDGPRDASSRSLLELEEPETVIIGVDSQATI